MSVALAVDDDEDELDNEMAAFLGMKPAAAAATAAGCRIFDCTPCLEVAVTLT